MAPHPKISTTYDDANAAIVSSTARDYSYKPLKHEHHEIRLVQVEPALHTNQAIECRLVHMSLDDNHAPTYKALSYTWGSPDLSNWISLDGQPVPVTENLEEFLRSFRSNVAEKLVLIWIDAISINQKDQDEKSEQISQMRRIFQQAEGILIWIGSDSVESQSAFKFLRDLGSSTSDSLSNLIRGGTRAKQLEALKQLFYRDYWWRIWVVQEVVVARTATVYCGADSISWEDLYAAGDRLALVREDIKSIYHDRPDSVYKLLSSGPRALKIPQLSEKEQPQLLDLLRSHKSKYSSDPRDKVFGLVGISDAQDTFIIDYSWDTRAVYTYTAKQIITMSQSLDVICVAKTDSNMYNLPSWVPDWTRTDAHTKHRVMGLHIRTPKFHAASTTLAITEFLEDGFVLLAKGVKIDKVESVGPALNLNLLQTQPHLSDREAKLHATCQAFLQWWIIFSNVRGHSRTEQDIFGRTIFGGSWAAVSESHEEHRLELFSSFCRALYPGTDINLPCRTSAGHHDNAKNQEAMVSAGSLKMHGKRLAISSSKLTGLAPGNTAEEDIFCVLLGCSFPVILRRVDDHYVLIGEAYVDEFMKGEAIAALDNGKYTLDTFELR